jgi:hypothetical protein
MVIQSIYQVNLHEKSMHRGEGRQYLMFLDIWRSLEVQSGTLTTNTHDANEISRDFRLRSAPGFV